MWTCCAAARRSWVEAGVELVQVQRPGRSVESPAEDDVEPLPVLREDRVPDLRGCPLRQEVLRRHGRGRWTMADVFGTWRGSPAVVR